MKLNQNNLDINEQNDLNIAVDVLARKESDLNCNKSLSCEHMMKSCMNKLKK
jgi:hypothetical protein